MLLSVRLSVNSVLLRGVGEGCNLILTYLILFYKPLIFLFSCAVTKRYNSRSGVFILVIRSSFSVIA